MIGIIQDYQIIAANLRPEKTAYKLYTEQWFLELNGSETRRMPIQFRGVSAKPSLIIGDEGIVKFEDKIQIGVTASKEFLVKNHSFFQVR